MTVRTHLKALYYQPVLNRVARPIYALFSPPPYRRADMEFSTDVWNGVSSFPSSDGRALGENNASPYIHCPVNSTLSKICSFPGSRNGLPVNVTALRTVMRVWEDVWQFAAMLRAQHLKLTGLPDRPLSLLQGYLLSKTAAGRVSFLIRSAGSRLTPADIDAVETAYFTLGVGPFMLARSLMEHGNVAAMECPQLSGDQLYQLADGHGTLVSAKGWACAGNPRLIVDFMDLVLNGTGSPDRFTSEPAKKAFDRIKDWDRLYAYLYASSRLELILKLARTVGEISGLTAPDSELSHTTNGSFAGPRGNLSNKLRINVALLRELRCEDPSVWLQLVAKERQADGLEMAQPVPAEAIREFAAKIQSAAQLELDQIGQALRRRPHQLNERIFLKRVWPELPVRCPA